MFLEPPHSVGATSMRDAAPCLCLGTAAEEERMMDGQNGAGTFKVETVLKDSVLNASVCDHVSFGAAVKRAESIEKLI